MTKPDDTSTMTDSSEELSQEQDAELNASDDETLSTKDSGDTEVEDTAQASASEEGESLEAAGQVEPATGQDTDGDVDDDTAATSDTASEDASFDAADGLTEGATAGEQDDSDELAAEGLESTDQDEEGVSLSGEEQSDTIVNEDTADMEDIPAMEAAEEDSAESEGEDDQAVARSADSEETEEADEGGSEGDAEEQPEVRPEWWLESALESLIFCAPEPIPATKLREILKQAGDTVELSDVKKALKTLVEKWNAADKPLGHGFELVETGGGFVFRTVRANARYLGKLFQAKPQRLSRASLEALAIIAYRQPVTRPQVDEIRGVDSTGALKHLIERKLVRILGKADEVGRPLIYGTTKEFLEFFQLKTLSDLPTLRDFQELKGIAVEPEAPKDTGGPVTVLDLFDPEKNANMVSPEVENEGNMALNALEEALGQATRVARAANKVSEDGQSPDAAAAKEKEQEAASTESEQPSDEEQLASAEPAEPAVEPAAEASETAVEDDDTAHGEETLEASTDPSESNVESHGMEEEPLEPGYDAAPELETEMVSADEATEENFMESDDLEDEAAAKLHSEVDESVSDEPSNAENSPLN